ncbi:hypothetical protein [Streptomyces calvus]|uniref:hypothetical protein n=1 Tax=Streptomyces calvus TaxID=67282 RepID=UPI0037233142
MEVVEVVEQDDAVARGPGEDAAGDQVGVGGRIVLRRVREAEPVRPTMRRAGSSRFVDRPVDDPGRRRPDTRLARERPGRQPRTGWTEGLARTVGWFSRAEAA